MGADRYHIRDCVRGAQASLARRGIHVHVRLVHLVVAYVWDQFALRPRGPIMKALQMHRYQALERPQRERVARRLADVYTPELFSLLRNELTLPPRSRPCRQLEPLKPDELLALYDMEEEARRAGDQRRVNVLSRVIKDLRP